MTETVSRLVDYIQNNRALKKRIHNMKQITVEPKSAVQRICCCIVLYVALLRQYSTRFDNGMAMKMIQTRAAHRKFLEEKKDFTKL